ncbi:MAG: MBL fold metallo-hydrolase, partial [Lachnospiraceae bacterium]|nr:MBL fold metallo-hydrolase [Lachnospiraceae bacterium]
MTENIEAFGQNSILVKDGEKNIYIDPFKMKETSNDADYILITHDHYDHFSPEDIDKVIGSNTILVVPEKMEGKTKKIADKFSKV